MGSNSLSGVKPRSLALGVQRLSHCTTCEVPIYSNSLVNYQFSHIIIIVQNRLRKVKEWAYTCFASIFNGRSMCSHVLQAVFKAQDKRDVAINMFLCIYVYIYNYVLYFSVAQSCPTLQPNGLQNTRLPCPSLSPRACSDSSPLSQWCHPTIIILCHPLLLQSFPALWSFQWVSSSHQVAKVLALQLQHQSFQWILRTDFLQDWLVWSLCSPRDSQESSPTPQFKSINPLALSLLYGPTLTSMTTWKIIALTIWSFADKVMSLPWL